MGRFDAKTEMLRGAEFGSFKARPQILRHLPIKGGSGSPEQALGHLDKCNGTKMMLQDL